MAIKPSPRFALTLLFLHTATAITVYVTAVPTAARLAAILLVSLSLFYYLARDVFLFLPGSWQGISLDQSGVSVAIRDGSSFFAQVANMTFISPYFVVLRVRLAGHRLLVSRVIFSDALSADEFRELCIRLKFA